MRLNGEVICKQIYSAQGCVLAEFANWRIGFSTSEWRALQLRIEADNSDSSNGVAINN